MCMRITPPPFEIKGANKCENPFCRIELKMFDNMSLPFAFSQEQQQNNKVIKVNGSCSSCHITMVTVVIWFQHVTSCPQ